MSAVKAKVVMVGPSKVGKTVLANIIADTSLELPKGEYIPTKGVRYVLQVVYIRNKRIASLFLIRGPSV